MYRPSFRGIGASALAATAALLLIPVALAAKNELFKCVSSTGVISIQSVACPAGSTQSWRRDATPEPPPTPEQAAQAEAKRLRDQQTVRELSEMLARKQPPPAPAPAASAIAPPTPAAALPTAGETADVLTCQTAQAFAGSVREKEWLGLTEEQTRRLFGWVVEQCKIPAKQN